MPNGTIFFNMQSPKIMNHITHICHTHPFLHQTEDITELTLGPSVVFWERHKGKEDYRIPPSI